VFFFLEPQAILSMKKTLSLSELLLAVGVLALCILASLMPPVPQNLAYHHFADARTIWGVPRALDSLSNIGFLVLGTYGLVLAKLGRLEFFSVALKASAITFFLGLVVTAGGSTYYHLAPDNPGLVVDRLGMVIVFAGVLGMAAAQYVSERAGWLMLGFALAAGPASVVYWHFSGSLTGYAMVQFGGIALACAMMFGTKRGPGPFWWGLLLTYGMAKVCETFDPTIFELTGHLVSGHTIKHMLAALPALAITEPLKRTGS
jgi:hypothetical protein